MLQRSKCDIWIADIARKYSPEKGVGPVVIHFTLRVSPMHALLGSLLHMSSDMCALIRLDWTVVDLLGGGCAALAGNVDRGQAAFLRLGLGHGFTSPTDLVALKMMLCGLAYPWALLPCTVIRVSPTQMTVSILGWSEEMNVIKTIT